MKVSSKRGRNHCPLTEKKFDTERKSAISLPSQTFFLSIFSLKLNFGVVAQRFSFTLLGLNF